MKPNLGLKKYNIIKSSLLEIQTAIYFIESVSFTRIELAEKNCGNNGNAVCAVDVQLLEFTIFVVFWSVF